MSYPGGPTVHAGPTGPLSYGRTSPHRDGGSHTAIFGTPRSHSNTQSDLPDTGTGRRGLAGEPEPGAGGRGGREEKEERTEGVDAGAAGWDEEEARRPRTAQEGRRGPKRATAARSGRRGAPGRKRDERPPAEQAGGAGSTRRTRSARGARSARGPPCGRGPLGPGAACAAVGLRGGEHAPDLVRLVARRSRSPRACGSDVIRPDPARLGQPFSFS